MVEPEFELSFVPLHPAPGIQVPRLSSHASALTQGPPSLSWALATSATVKEEHAFSRASVLTPGSVVNPLRMHGDARRPAHNGGCDTSPWMCPQLALKQEADYMERWTEVSVIVFP